MAHRSQRCIRTANAPIDPNTLWGNLLGPSKETLFRRQIWIRGAAMDIPAMVRKYPHEIDIPDRPGMLPACHCAVPALNPLQSTDAFPPPSLLPPPFFRTFSPPSVAAPGTTRLRKARKLRAQPPLPPCARPGTCARSAGSAGAEGFPFSHWPEITQRTHKISRF